MTLFKLIWTTLAFLTTVAGASADSLVERYGKLLSGLPETLRFDCSTDADDRFPIFDLIFRVPKDFESIDSRNSIYEWTVPVGGGIDTISFSRIELGLGNAAVANTHSLPAVSEYAENPLGARIVSLEPKPDDDTGDYVVWLVKDEQYLIIQSLVPIDWESLFNCFE